ncbi:putative ABC transport system permease protein [Microlunatus sagamiharensis]|uniref:Putative ABC transport system permease protein n=1 Tax=Microlunatus sagamiharensis TaxID=546874 RepID=A0A1H2LSI0_9ACTN|nr:ABC transporter permease [Microlunatus sagamiharensis]SDU83266.1 putative ABC transport system permease protein [Microlunatus sagamiharensis]
MTTLSVHLVVALAVLTALAVVVAALSRLGTARPDAVAVARAVGQLALVSLVLTAVLGRVVWSLAFAVVMLGVAVATSARRIGAGRAWPWVLVAVASGAVPVLVVIFASGAVPWTGPAIVPMAGIVIGGCMSASSLNGRRCFAALREERDTYEGALALGLEVPVAIRLVISRHRSESLVPGLDQTRTVGLVTLPGAFVGVLLGGGSPAQAGAAQLLVLVGLLAAQTVVVVVGSWLVERGRLVPTDLVAATRRRGGPVEPWPAEGAQPGLR